MSICEKELNISLLREKHPLQRVRKIAAKQDATIEDIINAIDDEIAYIDEMLYQKPPLMND